MKLEQISYSVDKTIQLKDSVNDYLQQGCTEEETTDLEEKLQGGILSDTRYSWLAKGPKLEVLHTKSGAKVAAWCFRAAHDFSTSVTCVADLGSTRGRAPLLVVGLECEITGGMLCVFDVGSSRVLRAIQIDDKVTSIEVVSCGCDSSLPGVLRALDGVVAVGTAKGRVLLIDLCRQICEEAITNIGHEIIRDEINSCHLIHLSFQDLRNLESHKEMSLNKGDHLCLQINEISTTGMHFSLLGPGGEVRLRANMTEVTVSALHFSAALGSLLVGYNFGSWQLYNLVCGSHPVLDYTSPMYEDCIPVTHFAVQEPCDDPRAFCYVWAAYSVQEVGDSGTSIAVMYALSYQTKDFLEGYGMLYQDLAACSVRFQLELAQVVGSARKNAGARCVSMRSYTRPLSPDAPEERLALCTLVWTTWDAATSDTYLALFDLNQWYKEQMPTQPLATHELNERYMKCVSLTELLAAGGALSRREELLDMCVDAQSLSPFICAQRLEEHYYPSALAFRGVCISQRSLIWMRSAGAQRHLLAQLELAGPLCLLQPADLYHRCVALGLCPQLYDLLPNPSQQQQRALVLSVALEQQLVRWLCQCAREWANGSQSSAGCTLDSLLDWAWKRANALKFSADKLCVPLFDHTGVRLDHNALLQLNHAACQLKHLTTLFDTVVHYCFQFFTQQDLDDIRYQWNSLQMISIYLEVLQWLLNVGLLPECPLSMYPRPDEAERMSAPYPVDSLTRFYTERRTELQESLLFIDQLVERECGGSTLSKQWKCDGGNGLYPPPSLQALLRTYLVEDIDITHKHCLFIYVFLDLAMTLDQSRYKSIITHLIKFPAVFKLSPSIIKMTQAFWQLDHGDFSTAMAQLLDPAVANEDLKPWHHRTVLKALLLQGQHQHALLYQQVRKPPVTSVQDICIVITLLIVNDLLQEAFHFQRQNRSIYNEKEILKHFFTVSDKMNHLSSILQLPLSEIEEQSFISYLNSTPSDTNQNLLVIYYLQRDRYAEAFRTNDTLNAVTGDVAKQGLLGQQDRNFRNVIVSGFKKTLPNVTQTLLDYRRQCENLFSEFKKRKVEEPKPMSVYVHESAEQAKFKSMYIKATLQLVRETWSEFLKDDEIPLVSNPKIASNPDKSNETPLIYASVMQPDQQSADLDPEAEMEATPAKRMRLSPRQPISTSNTSVIPRRRVSSVTAVDSPSLSLIHTPIVKRKSYRDHVQHEPSPVPSMVGTPTSILKVRSFIRESQSPDVYSMTKDKDARGTSTTPEVLDVEEDMEPDRDSNSGIVPLDRSAAKTLMSVGLNLSSAAASFISQPRRRSPLGVSPRRAIRPAVHFEEVGRPSSGSSDGSTTEQHLEVSIEVHHEQTFEQEPSSKDSTGDVFYSPNASLSDNTTANVADEVVTNVTESVLEILDVTEQLPEVESNENRGLLKRKTDNSIKSRRSYKSTTPVKEVVFRNIRDSLRSRDSLSKTEEPSSPRKSVSSRKSVTKYVESFPEIVATEESTPKKTDVFPKLGGRRSLSRQVLEQNALARAMQLPAMQTRLSLTKVPLLENIDQHTTGVEVSYSKTVTSIVKKSSDVGTEENCDRSTIEMKNIFTTEKDPESSAQIIKHVHNESSSKASVKKVTEDLDDDSKEIIVEKAPSRSDSFASSFIRSGNNRESDYHVLSFNSNVEDSMLQNSYQESDSPLFKFISDEKKQSFEKKEENKNEKNEIDVDVSINYESEPLEINKNTTANSTETVFEDISSIVEESISSESDEDEQMDTSIPTKDTAVSGNLQIREESKDSSEDLEKVSDQSEDSSDNVIVEAEIHEDREDNSALSNAENEESENNIEEVRSSEEETDVEEKLSNQEEEQESEDAEEDQVAAEDSEDYNESMPEEQSEAESEDNSSRFSDVIEIKSSSEESMESLKLNHSGETEEKDSEESEDEEKDNEVSENEESENEEKDNEEKDNRLEQNIAILEEIVEVDSENDTSEEIFQQKDQNIIETEQSSEEIKQMEVEIQQEIVDTRTVGQEITEAEEIQQEIADIQTVEQDVVEVEELQEIADIQTVEQDIAEVEEIQEIVDIQTVEQDVVKVEEIQEIADIQTTGQDTAGDATGVEKMQQEIADIQTIEQDTADDAAEVEEIQQEIIQEEESIELPEDIRLEIEECIREEEKSLKETEINETKETLNDQIEKVKTGSSTDTSKSNISQDCLETMNFSEPQEQLNQTDILCDENLAKDNPIQMVQENYVPSRRSKRISSKQETKKEVETVKSAPLLSTRKRRSMSVDLDNKSTAEEISSKPASKSRRNRSASVDIEIENEIIKPALSTSTRKISVDAEAKSTPAEEKSAPTSTRASTRKRSTSIDITPAEDKSSTPAPASTRKRSTSIDIEETSKSVRASTRRRSTSGDITPAEDKSSRAPTRGASTRKRSTSIDIEETSKPVGASTRRRSTSEDITPVEDISSRTPTRASTRKRSISIDIEETSKPVGASTRRRSTSEDITPAEDISSRTPTRASTRKRSTSIDIEETSKPVRASTRKRSTSVDITPAEDTSSRIPTRASTRKRSTSVDIEEISKPVRTSTRKRSSSIDIEKEVTPASRTRRTRSKSVDIEEESVKPQTTRSKRSTSIDTEEDNSRRTTRTSSIVNLPVIEEEAQHSQRTLRASSVDIESNASQRSKPTSSPGRRGKKRSITEKSESSETDVKKSALESIPEKIEEYSATHRLTRRQKMIMEKSLELQEMKKLEHSETKPRVDNIDPIVLLDKESFTGSPDLEEHQHREHSPVSSVGTASSVTHLTPDSAPSQKSQQHGGRHTSQGNTTPSTPRRSTRTMSRDTAPADMPAEDASSVRSVPVVRLDRSEVLRHRSLSPTALLAESAAPSARSKRKSTRSSILPTRIDLSKINEENSGEPDNASLEQHATAIKETQSKRGRRKKSDNTEAEESQASQSPASQTSKARFDRHRRTTSYTPLEAHLPRYSAYRTRKSFKIKNLTRKSTQ